MLAAQREFVANASHQLRTPLTGLRLRLESARAKAGRDAEPELEAAELEVERLARLLTSLLTLAREGDKPAAARPVSLARAAQRAYERWAGAAEQDGRELELAGSGDATIMASEEDLAILLDNLIENALRYSPTRVEVDWGRDGDEAWLAVLDEGPGLPPVRRRSCSTALRAAAPATRGPGRASGSRSSRRWPTAGAAPLRWRTGSKAARAPRCAFRPRLQWPRSHGSKPRRSHSRPRRPALRGRDGLRGVRRLTRLGRRPRHEAPTGAEGADAGSSEAASANPDAAGTDHDAHDPATAASASDDHRGRPWRRRFGQQRRRRRGDD